MGLVFCSLTVALWWHAAAPAAACSCAPLRGLEGLRQADAAFIGEVVRVDVEPGVWDRVEDLFGESQGTRIRVVFDVEHVFKGNVRATQGIFDFAPCAIGAEPGTALLVFAERRSGGLSTSMCSTRPITAADPPDGFPAAQAPLPGSSEDSFPRWISLAVAGVAIATLSAFVVRRRSAQRHHA